MFTWFEHLLRGTLSFILRHPLLIFACVTADLMGAFWGTLVWYGPQISAAPFWALPFIPDCPLAAYIAVIALLGLLAKRQLPLLNGLAAFACMKYGAWTIAFWPAAWQAGYPIEIIGVFMFITHIGLFVQGMLFIPHALPLSLPKRLGLIGWFVLSIFVDYGLGYHPPIAPVPASYALLSAVIATTILGIGLLAMPYRQAAKQTVVALSTSSVSPASS